MNKFKNLILFNILLFLISCGTIKDGFKNQKKNSIDEFLVEKKSPLTMPPDFNELPIPKPIQENSNKKENELKELFVKDDVINQSDNNKDENKNFEDSILDKIKNN
jgi:hypothetical protein